MTGQAVARDGCRPGWTYVLLLGSAAFCGASVMVIQLLGTRLMAPFYGTSLYVWTSLIAVSLLALALGYFFGGRWADRSGGAAYPWVLFAAGVATLAIPLLTGPVLLLTDPLGLRAGVFFSALLLFTPSFFLLGMVSPFVIRMVTDDLQRVGRSAGAVNAVGTLGSVFGTLLLGFFLFPLFGSREIILGVGALLLLLAGVVALTQGHRGLPLVAGVVLLLPTLSMLLPTQAAGGERSHYILRFEQESLYGWVRVIDDLRHGVRYLTADGSAIGAASLADGKNLLSYQQIVGLLPQLQPGMQRVLIIGQGAGHMATELHTRFGLTVDTLEIDPAVARAAREQFGFVPSGTALVGDARYLMHRLHGPYDLIIHDSFTGGAEPTHLLTREALAQVKGLLREGGLLALNFVSHYDDGRNPALASVSRTLEAVFATQRTFVSEPGHAFNDFIFLASDHPIDIGTGETRLTAEQHHWLAVREVEVTARYGRLLNDNLNPLEQMQTRKADAYRALQHAWFGPELLLR